MYVHTHILPAKGALILSQIINPRGHRLAASTEETNFGHTKGMMAGAGTTDLDIQKGLVPGILELGL